MTFRAASGNRDRPVKLAPSLLSADFADIADQIRMVESAGADELHLDSMDGVLRSELHVGDEDRRRHPQAHARCRSTVT